MNKIYSLCIIALLFLSASCSKDAKDYLKELEKLGNEYQDLMKENKLEEAKKFQEKGTLLINEIDKKAKEDPEFKKQIEKFAPDYLINFTDIPD